MLTLRKEHYFFYVILFSGLATSFFRSHYGLITLFLFGALFFGKTLLRPTRSLVIALSIWMLYFFINTIIIGSFHPFFMATYIIYLYVAWWLARYFGFGIFQLYTTIIYYLCFISLFFWVWQVLSPSSLTFLMSALNVAGDNLNSISIFVYTKHYLSDSTVIPRNAGFTWEPGPFSCFVALALFFNMARNHVSFKDKRRVMVFIVTIITTQSTTGFLLLLCLLGWYSWARFENKVFRFLLVPIVGLFIILVYLNVPFLKEKIDDQSQQDVYALTEHAEASGRTYNPGRFASLVLRYEDFKNYPVAGYGGNPKLQYGYLGEGNVVSAVSGIGKIFGQYGLIGSVIFVFVLYRSGILMANHFGYSGFLVFPIMVLMIGFSFSIIETPAIVVLLLLPFFVKRSDVEARH